MSLHGSGTERVATPYYNAQSLHTNGSPRSPLEEAGSQDVDGRNGPIEFRGRVIDESDHPIAGVRLEIVTYRLQIQRNSWGRVVDMKQVRMTNTYWSDHGGEFTLSGLRGTAMEVNFDADDFLVAPGTALVWVYDLQYPDRYQGEAGRREVFRLWRRKSPALLKCLSRGGQADPRGVEVARTLPTDDRMQNPEVLTIAARVWREPAILNTEQPELQLWKYSMSWRGARLQLTADVFPFEAPEDGYEEQVGETFTRGEDGFLDQLQRALYFRTDSGLYGRAELRIRAGDFGEEIGVYIDACWNPDGSRNLEPMP